MDTLRKVLVCYARAGRGSNRRAQFPDLEFLALTRRTRLTSLIVNSSPCRPSSEIIMRIIEWYMKILNYFHANRAISSCRLKIYFALSAPIYLNSWRLACKFGARASRFFALVGLCESMHVWDVIPSSPSAPVCDWHDSWRLAWKITRMCANGRMSPCQWFHYRDSRNKISDLSLLPLFKNNHIVSKAPTVQCVELLSWSDDSDPIRVDSVNT